MRRARTQPSALASSRSSRSSAYCAFEKLSDRSVQIPEIPQRFHDARLVPRRNRYCTTSPNAIRGLYVRDTPTIAAGNAYPPLSGTTQRAARCAERRMDPTESSCGAVLAGCDYPSRVQRWKGRRPSAGMMRKKLSRWDPHRCSLLLGQKVG